MSTAISGAIAEAVSDVILRIALVAAASRLAWVANSSRNASWSCGDPAEVGLEAELGLALAARGAGRGLRDRGDHPLADLVDQRQVEVLLGVEVLVEHRLGDAGGIGDVVHRGAVVAVAGEDLDRDVEDLLAAFAGGESGVHNGYPKGNGSR